jgi:hypothetical protein
MIRAIARTSLNLLRWIGGGRTAFKQTLSGCQSIRQHITFLDNILAVYPNNDLIRIDMIRLISRASIDTYTVNRQFE